MPQQPMPAAVEVLFKLRSQRMQEVRLGATLSKPDEDSDSVLSGTQNQAEISVDFDPTNEKYDLFYRSVNESKTGKVLSIIRTSVQSTLSGAINGTTTAFNIAAPSNTNSFFVGDIIEIEDELMVLLTWDSGTGAATVEERGAHGTAPVSHADTTVVAKMQYTVPHNSIVLNGNLDSGLPLAPTFIVVDNVVGSIGNGMSVNVGLPTSQIKSLFRIHIQTSTTLWAENFLDTTGLIGIQAAGSDGAIQQGGTSLVTSSVLNVAWAGKLIHKYETIDVVTGEVGSPDILRIDTVVDNGDGTWTVNISGDNVFNLRFGKRGTEGIVNWTIVDDWQRPGIPSNVIEQVKPFFNQGAAHGDPDVLDVIHTLWTAEIVYIRARLRNYEGYGPWMYHDGGTGTITRASATTFSATGIAAGALAAGAVTEASIANDSVTAAKLTENSMNYNSDLVFSATDNNTVAWASGTIEFADGSSFSIVAGNTGNMTALTYIYLDPDVSTTILQTTTTFNTALGDRKQIIAWAKNTALSGERAFFHHLFGNAILNSDFLGPDAVGSTQIKDNSISTPMLQANSVKAAQIEAGAIIAGKIAAGTITGDRMVANTITATQITGTTLSAIFADIGTITSGTSITGVLFRTAQPSNDRIEITTGGSPVIRWLDASNNLISSMIRSGNGISLTVDRNSTTGNMILATTHASSLIILNIQGASISTFRRSEIDFFQPLDMNTDDISNVGNIELDSISKDGGGTILVTNDLEMVGTVITAEEINADIHNTHSIGQPATRFANGFFVNIWASNVTDFNGVSYTWTNTGGSAGEQLQTNGSNVLTWESAGSLREWKNIQGPALLPKFGLEKMLAIDVFNFKYKKGHGPGDLETMYTGVMAEDFPEVMHHSNTIFSPVSAFGYSVLAIQALEARIRELEDKLNG